MNFFVDSSVCSLAFRRDATSGAAAVLALRQALEGGDTIVTTGVILQELLQGFAGPRVGKDIIDRFSALPQLMPDRQDHIDAAQLHNNCGRLGVQLGTIDTLPARRCIRHALTLLTPHQDFSHAAIYCSLRIWKPPG